MVVIMVGSVYFSSWGNDMSVYMVVARKIAASCGAQAEDLRL